MKKCVMALALAATMTTAAQAAADGAAVGAAAKKYVGDLNWQGETVLQSDFSCAGRMQQAILGTSFGEIVVAVFANGLDMPPEVLRFETVDRNTAKTKIRVDDYSLSADEIKAITGVAPKGYRVSDRCHGVRLSDDSSDAVHIYWDHDSKLFDTWIQ